MRSINMNYSYELAIILLTNEIFELEKLNM